MNATIIPEAITNYFTDNIPIEDTVYNCKDLHKFITYQKVNRDYTVLYNNQKIQRINRYYMSTTGSKLYKCQYDEDNNKIKESCMLKASGVTVVNNLENITKMPTDINYKYYLTEINKIIQPFKQIQLSLF